jgi:glycolate oxidase iron-sulfur subunit
MNDNEAARVMARTNIDAWWPHLQNGAEALVVTATGCSKFLMGYDKLLADDPAYAHKAREVATRVRDITEQFATEVLPEVGDDAPRLAFHAPCSLTHGLKLDQTVTDILRRCGFALTEVPDSHLCCGAGGAYMLLHPRISRKLGQNRADALQSDTPQAIATANIGCQLQLSRYSKLPVRHWLEWLAESIPSARK